MPPRIYPKPCSATSADLAPRMTHLRRPTRAYIPRAPASHLLRAALLDGALAASAWQEGRAAFEAPESQRDPAAAWLGPLLAANIERLAPGDPMLPSLRAAADKTAERNEHLF